MPTTVTRLLLLALLLLAFALRVYALDRYPTGVSPDEAGDVIDILNIAHSGHFPIYEDYAIPEPLHRILYALLSLAVGNSVGSIRFLGACFGVLTVALVGWVARLGFRSAAPGRDQVANQITDQTADQTIGSADDNAEAMQETLMVVASVAMLTLSLSHIVISRSIYRAILQPVFTLFFLGYLLRGLAHYRWRDYSTSGMSLALTLYSYTAGMVVPGAIGLLGLQLLVTRIRSWRRWLPSLVLLGIVFLLCIAPILYTLWTAPHFVIGRASELNDGPKAAVGWNEIVRMVNQFVVAGDVNLQYNIASAPLVSTLWLPFFVVGLVALLVKIRKPVSVLLGGLLILATIPVIFAGEIPHGLRIMGVFAVLPLIIGTGFADATRLLWRLPLLKQLSTQKQFVFSLVLLVALIGVQSYQSVTGYFLYWSTAAPQQTNFIFNRQLPSNEWYFRPDRRDLAAWIRAQSAPLLLPREELVQQTTHGWLAADFPEVSTLSEPITLPVGTTLVIPWSLEAGDLERTTRHFALLQRGRIQLLPPLSPASQQKLLLDIDTTTAITRSGTLDLMAKIRLLPADFKLEFEPALYPVRPQQALAHFQPGMTIHAVRGPLVISDSVGELTYTLEWKPLQPVNHFYSSFLQLQTQSGERIAGDDVFMGRWLLATPYWPPNQIMADIHHLPLTTPLAPGAYKLMAGLYLSVNEWIPTVNDEGVVQGNVAQIAWVKRPMPLVPPLPSAAKAFSAALDNAIVLRHASVNQVDATYFELSLEWMSRVDRPDFDATIFLHVVDSAGNMVAQQDKRPFDGQYPTFIWDKEERVVTKHQFELSQPAETMHLFAGMYTFPDLQRLPVSQDGAAVADSRIDLGTLGELNDKVAR